MFVANLKKNEKKNKFKCCLDCGASIKEVSKKENTSVYICTRCSTQITVESKKDLKNASPKSAGVSRTRTGKSGGILVRDRSKENMKKELNEKEAVQDTNQEKPKEVNQVEENLKKIQASLKETKILQFTYVDSKGNKSVRSVEPYKILTKGNNVLLYGFCLEKNEIRTFSLGSIIDLDMQQFTFQPRWPIETNSDENKKEEIKPNVT